jgi:hypothetical protein
MQSEINKLELSRESHRPARLADAGKRLKTARKGCNLRYQDVVAKTKRIADPRPEFAIPMSRLADIERPPDSDHLQALVSVRGHRLECRC